MQDLCAVGEERRVSLSEVESSLIEFCERGNQAHCDAALVGSEVRFRLQSNRPLREGTLEITAGDQSLQRVTLTNSAENEVSGAFLAAESGRLHFSVTDVAGIPSQGECEGALTVTHDLPPEVRITEPEHDALVAMDFKVKARAEANDDYGLRAVRFHRGLNLLTGETGSGKSIVVDALALVFGGRASAEMVRSGAAQARVSAIFEIPPAAQAMLEQAGIEIPGEDDAERTHGGVEADHCGIDAAGLQDDVEQRIGQAEADIGDDDGGDRGDQVLERAALPCPAPLAAHGHLTSGGMEERIESTLPPVLRPNRVPRS